MMKLDPNDPRLTAYALDEMDDAARGPVAAALADDPNARRELDAIRATAGLLAASLRSEPTAELAPDQRQAVLGRARSAATEARPVGLSSLWPHGLRLPAFTTRRLAAVAAVMIAAIGLYGFGRLNVTPLYYWVASLRDAGSQQDLRRSSIPEEYENMSALELAREMITGGGEAKMGSAPDYRAPAGSAAVATMPPPAPQTGGPMALGLPADVLVESEAAAGPRAAEPVPGYPPPDTDWNTEAYDRVVDNPFLSVVEEPLSTFSIDVDTASYSNVRRFLQQYGEVPPPDAVRIEEMVNYFDYSYSPPTGDEPFATHVEIADAPWAPSHRLAMIGLKGREVAGDARPPANLVFLLDVSGSMEDYNKLPYVKEAMGLLVEQLRPTDRVAIVVYAGEYGVALDSTPASDRQRILDAIYGLQSGGSTNGAGGIEAAYRIAADNFLAGGTNRVILCTDGDFNVGVTSTGDLTRLIEERAKTGVYLTALGFGMGNYKDTTLEALADKGNGNYGYIDTLSEAKKLLVEQMSGTLVTIAKDVKIQVEFNPAVVSAYRLIGYENRVLAAQDFNDDAKDAGEIGAGHTVTALYEVVPVGVPIDVPGIDPLKYQQPPGPSEAAASGEMLTLKLRYKLPEGDEPSRPVEYPIVDGGRTLAEASGDLRFAAGVAAFGMLLRNSPYAGDASYPMVRSLAESGLGTDDHGYRAEFLDLVARAARMTPQE